MSDEFGGGGEERLFTVDEANAMLADLRPTLEGMREARRIVLASAEHVRGSVAGNGGGKPAGEYADALELLGRETERLSAEGILIRDVDAGLVDFPSERDGQPVFLCWKLGEDEVGYWHPVDTGFSGRRPL
jgi:hypothetical protein